MQQFPLTLLSLAVVFASLLLLRCRWHSLLPRTRRSALAAALLAILIFVAAYATKWVTASDRLNSAFYWAALTGYLLLLVLHTLNRPRWLTIPTAIILGLPVFASSIFLPLDALFHPSPRLTHRLDTDQYVSFQTFTEVGTSSTGRDIDIFYRPRLFPLFQRTRLGGRFFDSRCDTAALEVVLEPDHNSVFVRCPPWPGSGETDPGAIFRLHH